MLRFSLTGKYLALVGHKGISVIEMPQRWGRFAEYQGGSDTVNCRYEKYFESMYRNIASSADASV
jgi:esterase/lipase superfamily enzyme